MPNWCENYVDICGPVEAMNHFIDTYCERDPNMPSEVRICFGKIIPIEQMPDEEGQIRGWAQINHQADRWGCKWDSEGYELSVNELDFWRTGEDGEHLPGIEIRGTMDTPWGPPEHVVARIRELFKDDPKLDGCSVDEWFYKEPGMELAGWL